MPEKMEVSVGTKATFVLRPAAGYVATQLYWSGGGVRDLTWWDELKRSLRVNVVHTVSWGVIAKAWTACRYSGLSSLNRPLKEALEKVKEALEEDDSDFVVKGRFDCHASEIIVEVPLPAIVRMTSAPYSLLHVSNQTSHLEYQMTELAVDIFKQLTEIKEAIMHDNG